ncbi:MAG: alpha/beta hydrolase [Clostridia bacterium]|nr:alpha/beta hydrolase [Clostridia bacterium]
MIIFLILLTVFILIFAVLLFSYLKTFARSKKLAVYDMSKEAHFNDCIEITKNLAEKIKNEPCEKVYILSHDKIKLHAKVYDFYKNAPVQILFHGYRGSAFRDMCGGFYLAKKSGHNVILIDQRAHGESGSNTITFGVKERFDALKWVDFAIQRYGETVPIIISGVSMGATTVLMASGENLPKNVKAIIADSPFSSAEDVIKNTIKNMRLPINPTYFLVKLSGLIFGRFNLSSPTPLTQISKCDIPILIFHGEKDGFVPVKMSEKLAQINPEKVTLCLFKDAGHALSYLTEPDKYERVVNEFLSKNGLLNA